NGKFERQNPPAVLLAPRSRPIPRPYRLRSPSYYPPRSLLFTTLNTDTPKKKTPTETLRKTMPTPESEAFLSKKPKRPATFDGVDYEDDNALKAAQDAVLREQWVKCMMGRLVREELDKCYRANGINHLEKCASLRGRRFLPLLLPPSGGEC